MKSLKNPMTNAIYIASITAIYAMIFIVSSEFVSKYAYWLSDSRWSLFIQNKNMKFIGLALVSYIQFRAVPAIQNNTISNYGTEITIVSLGICAYIILVAMIAVIRGFKYSKK